MKVILILLHLGNIGNDYADIAGKIWGQSRISTALSPM
jgi:hypothetical protein